MNKNSKNQLRYCILIADDDADDQLMMKDALRAAKFDKEIETVNDGEELLDYLFKRGKFKELDLPMPKLILLDLNMPKKDGKTVLKEIKADSIWSKIPVIIYSTSDNMEDVSAAYELGACSYIIKPYSYKDLLGIAEIFKKYWFATVITPICSHDR